MVPSCTFTEPALACRNGTVSTPTPPQVEIVYYTDPLCSWSWAFEPHWRRLRYEFADQISRRMVMGGLIANWQQFADPLNDISRPAQMGPAWLQVEQISGMPVAAGIWSVDPPASSYPACIAVKAAEQQGQTIGAMYLRRLREAVMLEQRNIARSEVLPALAEELSAHLDFAQFQHDLNSAPVLEAFREDLKDARYRDIGRFPTLIMRHATGPAVIVVGYRPYPALRAALAQIAPDLAPTQLVSDLTAYVAFWQRVTAGEIAVAYDLDLAAATRMLDEAVTRGMLNRDGQLYRPQVAPLEPARGA